MLNAKVELRTIRRLHPSRATKGWESGSELLSQVRNQQYNITCGTNPTAEETLMHASVQAQSLNQQGLMSFQMDWDYIVVGSGFGGAMLELVHREAKWRKTWSWTIAYC